MCRYQRQGGLGQPDIRLHAFLREQAFLYQNPARIRSRWIEERDRYAVPLLQRSGEFLQREVELGAAEDTARKRNLWSELARNPGRTNLTLWRHRTTDMVLATRPDSRAGTDTGHSRQVVSRVFKYDIAPDPFAKIHREMGAHPLHPTGSEADK